MENKEAYNAWSGSYDAVENKTRDLEAIAIRTMLDGFEFSTALELGAGTGKNTGWLATKAGQVTAADFSAEMLTRAKQNIHAGNIHYSLADITEAWSFIDHKVDLITCSLVLEHIENIDFIFEQAANKLVSGGHFYIGELHPFKQYQGSKARFDTGTGIFELGCFVHHISDYMQAAAKHHFSCNVLKEWFDDNDLDNIPRIVAFLFERN
jgi:ubiquinone/menaquinone biosynthesis C-methylase UbiE